MNEAMIWCYLKMQNAKTWCKDFSRRLVEDETGAAGIIAAIILVAIVIVLATFFRGKIVSLVESIWGDVDKQAAGLTAPINTGG